MVTPIRVRQESAAPRSLRLDHGILDRFHLHAPRAKRARSASLACRLQKHVVMCEAGGYIEGIDGGDRWRIPSICRNTGVMNLIDWIDAGRCLMTLY